jgi:hypothetical protein
MFVCHVAGEIQQTYSGIIFLTANVDVMDEESWQSTFAPPSKIAAGFFNPLVLWSASRKNLLAEDFYFSRELC